MQINEQNWLSNEAIAHYTNLFNYFLIERSRNGSDTKNKMERRYYVGEIVGEVKEILSINVINNSLIVEFSIDYLAKSRSENRSKIYNYIFRSAEEIEKVLNVNNFYSFESPFLL